VTMGFAVCSYSSGRGRLFWVLHDKCWDSQVAVSELRTALLFSMSVSELATAARW
jgi:hypothetical protein